MALYGIEIFALLGFLFGAYSIVGNDAIQTLGTFMSSNSQRSWPVLWLYACSIIVAVMAFGFYMNAGDIAYGRLDRVPLPEGGIQWWHVVPPLVLLFLTRFGIPVSTTFLVLTVFTLSASSGGVEVFTKMVTKSALGYVVAIGAGFAVYATVAKGFERWIHATPRDSHGLNWTILQWCSTAFLWSQWLIQDLANIFVYLPRTYTDVMNDAGEVIGQSVAFDGGLIIFATLVMLGLHAYIFATRGGEIQKIVLSKTSTTDVRAATVVDFIYGIILIFFKEMSNIPMSTTWVFLGLLAGREIAIAYVAGLRDRKEAVFDVVTDVVRAFIGLLVSVVLAVGLPWLATGQAPSFLQ